MPKLTPTSIKKLKAKHQRREIPDAHDLSSLRLLGTVGEPINPEAWRWYHDVFGAGKLPIVDTWWQTETGSAMISPLPGIAAAKPGSAMTPLPGISAKIVDDHGDLLQPDSDNAKVLAKPVHLRELVSEVNKMLAA